MNSIRFLIQNSDCPSLTHNLELVTFLTRSVVTRFKNVGGALVTTLYPDPKNSFENCLIREYEITLSLS
jgi:hypothetical protein